jgi:hypothetical protein
VQSFSLGVLKDLRMHHSLQLCSAPTTRLWKYNEKKRHTLRDAHLICFPWAVVEVKKLGDGGAVETFCYCQAANASAAALALREQLAQKSGAATKLHDALVIFAFTFVGPSIKLWVTYRAPVSITIDSRLLAQKSLTKIY